MSSITEVTLEQTALSWFENLGYQILHGPDIAPGEPQAERDSYSEVVLKAYHEQEKAGLSF